MTLYMPAMTSAHAAIARAVSAKYNSHAATRYTATHRTTRSTCGSRNDPMPVAAIATATTTAATAVGAWGLLLRKPAATTATHADNAST